MEYKEADRLVLGQRYYIVPLDRLKTNRLVTMKMTYGQYVATAKPIPAAKKGTILLQSAVVTENNPSYPYNRTFAEFWNKDGKPLSKSPCVINGEFRYFSYDPTPVIAIGSTVSEANVATTVGNLSSNYMPPSMNSAAAAATSATTADAGAGSAVSSAVSSAVQKSTDLLIKTLTLGESGSVTIPAILKRANPPLLENLVNRPLSYDNGSQIIPNEFDIPPNKGFQAQHINVESPYGALELLIKSNERIFSHEDKEKYIRLLVSMGADPSNALVTAILHYDLPIVNLLLDLGADPNIVREYKTPDGEKRFLTSPLLASLPVKPVQSWNGIADILDSLTKFRTFVEKDGRLVLVDRDSIPDGTPVYETVAHITPTVLDTLQKRLDDHVEATEILKAAPRSSSYFLLQPAHYEKYTEFLNTMIGFLRGKSEHQGPRLAEPGGPLYEEARARAYGKNIGTRGEQLARNLAANKAFSNVVLRNNAPSNELQRMALLAEHGIKTRKRASNRRRYTRRR